MTKKKNVTMNKDLQQWVKNSKEQIKKSKKEKYKEKKPTGKCEICGEKKATSVCLKCGRSVCRSCYFKIISVCKKCVPEDISKKWDGSNPDWEKELGVDWVD